MHPNERKGIAFLTRITAAMTEFQMENRRLAEPRSGDVAARKFYVDNPDTLYPRHARSAPELSRGRRGEELYLAFCVYGLRGRSNAILANVCDDEMIFADDGTFELVLSTERPEGAANWLPLNGNARTLVTRQYFTNRNQRPAELNIETLEPQSPPSAPDEN